MSNKVFAWIVVISLAALPTVLVLQHKSMLALLVSLYAWCTVIAVIELLKSYNERL